MFYRLIALILLPLTLPLFGCSYLTPSGAMQVDVSVYKGPLSKPKEIQRAELEAVIDEALKMFKDAQTFTLVLGPKKITEKLRGEFRDAPECPPKPLTVSGAINRSIINGGNPTWPTIYSHVASAVSALECLQLAFNGPSQNFGQIQDHIDFLDNSAKDAEKIIQETNNLIQETDGKMQVMQKVIQQEQKRIQEKQGQIRAKQRQSLQRQKDVNREISTAYAKLKQEKNKQEKSQKNFDSDKKKKEELKNLLIETSKLGMAFQAKATSMIGYLNTHQDLLPRGVLDFHRSWPFATLNRLTSRIVRLAILFAEYGNQLSSRTDLLYKLEIDGKTIKELPLRDYLRDSSPSDFNKLHEWMETVLMKSEAPVRHRLFSHLYHDRYWSNINRVYASGIGKTRIALVRDDLGNWNLKGFANDPSEVTKAFGNMTTALAKSVADAAAKVGTGGGNIALTQAISALKTATTPKRDSEQKIYNKIIEKAKEELDRDITDFLDNNKGKAFTSKEEEELAEILNKYQIVLDAIP
ncbi:hypothetical protein ACQZV8_06415 [Magnetococcales bacterium HHB-1]